jgi:hypothetical protein
MMPGGKLERLTAETIEQRATGNFSALARDFLKNY